MQVEEHSARCFCHYAPFGCSVGQQPTAAETLSLGGNRTLDKRTRRPQVWAVVSYALRLRLVFSMLTAFLGVSVGVYAWPGAVQAQDSVASQAAQLRSAQLPTAPQDEPAHQMSDVQSAEDSPDDEEFADMSRRPLGRAPAFLQCGPASLQLEPSHAPSTGLDRPPRV